MFHRWVRYLLLGVAASSVLQVGCSSDSNPNTASEAESNAGTLRLPILTPSGASYRLRNAVFEVSNANGLSLSLDSEAAPDASTIDAELDQGTYAISLKAGWALERVVSDGSVVNVRAALLTSNPSAFEIRHERVTEIVYSFATDDGTIAFGRGSASVGFEVAASAPSTDCNLLSGSGCPTGQTCLLADDDGSTFCATAGALRVGEACDSEQCVPGAQCLRLDEEHPDSGVCTKFCNARSSEFGCVCRSLSFDANIGICEAAPAGSCNPFDTATCAQGQACHYDGGGYGTCAAAGSLSTGETCLGDDCAPGLECYGDVPEQGVPGRCWQFCDTRNGGYFCGVASAEGINFFTYCRNPFGSPVGLCLP